jgi:hypothetical protein
MAGCCAKQIANPESGELNFPWLQPGEYLNQQFGFSQTILFIFIS